MERPELVILSAAFAAGIAVAPPAAAPLVSVAFGLAALTAAALGVARARRPVAALAVLVGVFGGGVLRGLVAPAPSGPPALATPDAAFVATGVVRDGPWPRADGVWLDVETTSAPAPGEMVRVYYAAQAVDLGPGDPVSFRARWRIRHDSANPGAPDLGDRVPRRSAHVVPGTPIVRIGPPEPVRGVLPFARARHRLAWRLREVAGARAGGVLAALGLGAHRLVPATEREQLARSGTAHALAVSGLHLGFVALWLFAMFRWSLTRSEALALRWPVHRLAAAATLVGVTLFALWTGARVATLRALAMAAVLLLARLLGRRASASDALAVAVFALLLADPAELRSPSFQLSVAAVLAILWSAEAGRRFVDRVVPADACGPWLLRAGRHLAGALWVSLAAGLGTAPVLLAHFGRLAPISVLANLVVVPWLGFVVLPAALLSVLAVGFLPASAHATALAVPARLVDAWLDAIDGFSALAPTPALAADALDLVWLAVGGAFLLRVPTARHRGRRFALAALLLLAPFLRAGLTPLPHDRFSAWFLDVGHGTAVVLRLPADHTMLVDGGGHRDGRPGIGRARVLPALRALGRSRVHTMVLTHGHADHVTGLLEVAQAMPVDELWLPAGPSAATLQRRLERVVAARGGRVRRLARGVPVRRFGEVTVEVLWPPRTGAPPGENNRSLVLRVGVPGARLLLTGDIEAPAEAALLATGAPLAAELALAPHHGSATSSSPAFLDAVAARVVVFSRGPGTNPRLPAADVFRRIRDRGGHPFDTTQDGAVTVRGEPGELEVCSQGSVAPRWPSRRRACYRLVTAWPAAAAPPGAGTGAGGARPSPGATAAAVRPAAAPRRAPPAGRAPRPAPAGWAAPATARPAPTGP